MKPKSSNEDNDLALSSDDSDETSSEEEEEDPYKIKDHEPLVLWEPTEEQKTEGFIPVQVPGVLAQFLRPHQREGVQFCYNCVMNVKDFGGQGCILADDMGLGKTLQSITLMYTLLKTGLKEGQRTVKRAIVVCPCSLVNNWKQEFDKWINSRVRPDENEKAKKVTALAMSGSPLLLPPRSHVHGADATAPPRDGPMI